MVWENRMISNAQVQEVWVLQAWMGEQVGARTFGTRR